MAPATERLPGAALHFISHQHVQPSRSAVVRGERIVRRACEIIEPLPSAAKAMWSRASRAWVQGGT